MLIRPKVRMDSEGSGEYGAPRGKRKHKGIDFCVDKGVEVRSHIDGVVSKLGKPYYFANPNKKQKKQNDLRYVEVVDTKNIRHRFFYIDPKVDIGDPIEAGDVLGIQQDLQAIYGKDMKNHCHYETKIGGEFPDPSKYL